MQVIVVNSLCAAPRAFSHFAAAVRQTIDKMASGRAFRDSLCSLPLIDTPICGFYASLLSFNCLMISAEKKGTALDRHRSQCDDLLVSLDRDRQWPQVQQAIFQWLSQNSVALLGMHESRAIEDAHYGAEHLQVNSGLTERAGIAWSTVHLGQVGNERSFRESVNNTLLHRLTPVMRLVLVREGLQKQIEDLFRIHAARCLVGLAPSDQLDVSKPALSAFDQLRQGKLTSVTASAGINGHELPRHDKKIWRSVFGE